MDFETQADLVRALLFRPAVRQRLVEAGAEAFEPEASDLLAAVDAQQLVRTTRRMATDTRTRRSRGVGALTDVFVQSLGGLSETEVADLFEDFVASPQYAAVNEVPDRDDTPSVEEAFHDFLADRDVGETHTRRRALLTALLRLLTVTPEPAFRPPAEVRRTRSGYVAVQRTPTATWLFAAVDGRFLTGQITTVVADRLEGVVVEEDALAAKLRGLGLMDGG